MGAPDPGAPSLIPVIGRLRVRGAHPDSRPDSVEVERMTAQAQPIVTEAPVAIAETGRGGGLRGGRTAYAYLVPAFIVMGIITIYPLLFQVYLSFTDLRHRQPPRGGRAGERRRHEELHRHPRERPRDPELPLRSPDHLQHLVGPQQRRPAPRRRGRDRAPAQHEGPALQAFLPRAVHHPGRHPAAHRRDGLDGTCTTRPTAP